MMLKSSSLFGGLSKRALLQLISLGKSSTTHAGQSLYHQGEAGTTLFLIISGEIRISASSADGKVLHLNTLATGDVMGEIALLDGGPRTATATVTQSGMVFSIERSDFLAFVEQQPDVTIELLKLVCRRVRWTTGLLEDSVFLTSEARLAKRLLWISQSSGSSVAGGYEIRLSQSDLAQYLNLSRQIVNRFLRSLEAAGIVELGRGKLVIRDQMALLAKTVA